MIDQKFKEKLKLLLSEFAELQDKRVQIEKQTVEQKSKTNDEPVDVDRLEDAVMMAKALDAGKAELQKIIERQAQIGNEVEKLFNELPEETVQAIASRVIKVGNKYFALRFEYKNRIPPKFYLSKILCSDNKNNISGWVSLFDRDF